MNRLTASYTHTAIGGSATSWDNTSISAPYAEFFGYDANGNITVMNRYGANITGMPLNMDQLIYNYNRDGNFKLINNRLNYIMDFMPNNAYTVDIDNQSANNYKYDKIGNLIGDVATGMNGTTNRINWTVYGKIASIKKSTGTTSYSYDAGGNRITKTLSATKADYYVRDAQGNVMGIYSYDNTSFTWAEQHLYGSSRVGMVTPGLSIQSSAPLANASYNATGDPIPNGTEGKRVYELSNHLSNVMVTISDRKIGVDDNSDTVIDYYTAEVLTSQDYYAFGMLMPGRQYSNAGAKYKFGFNGQEKSTEIEPNGNSMTAEFWQYDTRLGRRWNLDPKPTTGVSLYSTFQNNPIVNLDPLGDTVFVKVTDKVVGYTKINLYSSSEIAAKPSRRNSKVWVPVYEVQVSNESGESAIYHFTRYNERARVKNNDAIEDVTFDVRNSQDVFAGVPKNRWGKRNNVLELRKFSNTQSQTVSGMKGEKYKDRVAIQFHVKGASDGCLLAVPVSEIIVRRTLINSIGEASMSDFMQTILNYRANEQRNGNSEFIKVSFNKIAGTPEYCEQIQTTEYTRNYMNME